MRLIILSTLMFVGIITAAAASPVSNSQRIICNFDWCDADFCREMYSVNSQEGKLGLIKKNGEVVFIDTARFSENKIIYTEDTYTSSDPEGKVQARRIYTIDRSSLLTQSHEVWEIGERILSFEELRQRFLDGIKRGVVLFGGGMFVTGLVSEGKCEIFRPQI